MSSRFSRQLDVLVDRNLAVQLGAPGSLGAVLLQAPAIGAFIGLAWRGQEPTPATYFVMAVAAVWMGCMNACTAIVQERAIYDRERMFDLDVGAYVFSKLAVLAAVGVAQTLLLLGVQGRLMRLSEALAPELLGFAVLALANFTAASIGLTLSCAASSSYGAVVLVPIALIPHVLFSRVILQSNVDHGLPRLLEGLTVTKWVYDSLVDARSGWTFVEQLKCFSALTAGAAFNTAVAYLKLRWDDR